VVFVSNANTGRQNNPAKGAEFVTFTEGASVEASHRTRTVMFAVKSGSEIERRIAPAWGRISRVFVFGTAAPASGARTPSLSRMENLRMQATGRLLEKVTNR